MSILANNNPKIHSLRLKITILIKLIKQKKKRKFLNNLNSQSNNSIKRKKRVRDLIQHRNNKIN